MGKEGGHTNEALVVHAVKGEVLDLSMAKNTPSKAAEGRKNRASLHVDVAQILVQNVLILNDSSNMMTNIAKVWNIYRSLV